MAERPYDALAVAAIGLQSLALALRRQWPAVCLSLVAAGFVLDQLRGYHTVAGTALPLALLSTGAHLERYRRTTVAVGSLAYVLFVAELVRRGTEEPAAELVSFYVAMCLLWGGGAWLRSTRIAEAFSSRHSRGMISAICSTMLGCTPSDGSSRRNSRGRAQMARPSASICCSPPDSVPPACVRRLESAGK